MNRIVPCVLLLLALCAPGVRAEEATHVCRYCDHSRATHFHRYFAPVEGPLANGRNYAPDRIVDVLNV